MLRDGWLTTRKAKEGKRPVKQIFSLTPFGEQQFIALLRDCLSQYKTPAAPHDVAFMFIGELPSEEVVKLLEKKLSSITDARTAISKSIIGHGGNSIIRHQMEHIELDLAYIRGLVKTMGNEGGKQNG